MSWQSCSSRSRVTHRSMRSPALCGTSLYGSGDADDTAASKTPRRGENNARMERRSARSGRGEEVADCPIGVEAHVLEQQAAAMGLLAHDQCLRLMDMRFAVHLQGKSDFHQCLRRQHDASGLDEGSSQADVQALRAEQAQRAVKNDGIEVDRSAPIPTMFQFHLLSSDRRETRPTRQWMSLLRRKGKRGR